MLLAVNGTLMRGLELNKNMLNVGASFIREDKTSPNYRLYSIDDKYPGMIYSDGGSSIHLEIWEISPQGLVEILEKEPPGLSIGYILLQNGERVLGALAESYILVGKKEITSFRGWRNYINSR
jgi:gamma-glutamylcyclotransferase (GGCT)/AIG2-like uncharacterized protein YtfP